MSEFGAGTHDELRTLLGPYVLGGLSAADRALVETHLRECAACREQLAELTPVRFVLDRTHPWIIDDEGGQPSADVPVDQFAVRRLLARANADQTTRPRGTGRRWLIAAAVILLVVVGGFFSSQLVGPAAPTTSVAVLQTDSHASGEVTVMERAWGTALHLEAAGLTYKGQLTLEVQAKDGHRETAATWGQTPSGTCKVDGATSIAPSAIRAVRVVDAAGHDVLWAKLS